MFFSDAPSPNNFSEVFGGWESSEIIQPNDAENAATRPIE